MSLETHSLFTGTAQFYAKFRLCYPRELIEMIVGFYPQAGRSRVLDLGCGTGQLTVPLSSYFEQAVGVDINAEMIEQARRESLRQGIDNVEWHHMPAEEVDRLHQPYDLIVSGNSFHWMDRELILNKSYELLNDKGGMVILAGNSVWNGEQDWQRRTVQVIRKWLGGERKAGQGLYPKKPKLHEEFIKESRFQLAKKGDFYFSHAWSLEEFLGYLYSTSFCNKSLLGDAAGAFEEELSRELLRLHPDGVFREEVEITYFFLTRSC